MPEPPEPALSYLGTPSPDNEPTQPLPIVQPREVTAPAPLDSDIDIDIEDTREGDFEDAPDDTSDDPSDEQAPPPPPAWR